MTLASRLMARPASANSWRDIIKPTDTSNLNWPRSIPSPTKLSAQPSALPISYGRNAPPALALRHETFVADLPGTRLPDECRGGRAKAHHDQGRTGVQTHAARQRHHRLPVGARQASRREVGETAGQRIQAARFQADGRRRRDGLEIPGAGRGEDRDQSKLPPALGKRGEAGRDHQLCGGDQGRERQGKEARPQTRQLIQETARDAKYS